MVMRWDNKTKSYVRIPWDTATPEEQRKATAFDQQLLSEHFGRELPEFQDFATVITKAIGDWMEQLMPAMMKLTEWFEQSIQEPYRQAGAPHGDTPDGAVRWFREQHEEERSQLQKQVDTLQEEVRTLTFPRNQGVGEG